jgi:hypothetical protein
MTDDMALLGDPCPDCGAESMVPCFVFCGSRFEDAK